MGRVTEIRNIRAVRYGWANHDGRATEARCGVLFANTLGATMSRDLKPYVGRIGTGVSGAVIWKEDTGTDDAGTNFQAYAITKAYALQQGQNMGVLEDSYLTAETASGVTITLTLNRDFGLETTTATALLTASASETRVQQKFEGAAISQAGYLQFQVGDASAASNAWVLDSIATPLLHEGTR